MPRMVEQLTARELELKQAVEQHFTAEEQCAYYLTKTIRSVYQMSDEQTREWRDELRGLWQEHKGTPFPFDHLSARQGIVLAYSVVLVEDQMYEFHLDYWLRHYQDRLSVELAEFHAGLPPHLAD